MLSDEEKKEMLEDAKNRIRREHFRIAKEKDIAIDSFDDYILFLNSVQKIFAPFRISTTPTPTKLNKL